MSDTAQQIWDEICVETVKGGDRTSVEIIDGYLLRLNEFYAYWLTRAYESGRREGWEEGPSTNETLRNINQVIGLMGYNPEDGSRETLLKKSFMWTFDKTLPPTLPLPTGRKS